MGVILAALDALTRGRPNTLLREAIEACDAFDDGEDDIDNGEELGLETDGGAVSCEDAHVQCDIISVEDVQHERAAGDALRARVREQTSQLEMARTETRELRVEVERATAEVTRRRRSLQMRTTSTMTENASSSMDATPPSRSSSRVVFVHQKPRWTNSTTASPAKMTTPPTTTTRMNASSSSLASRDLVATTLSTKLSGAQARVKRLEAENKDLQEKLRESEMLALEKQRQATPSDKVKHSLRNSEHVASILRRGLAARTKECAVKDATIQKLEKRLTQAHDSNENDCVHSKNGSSKKCEKLEKLLLARETELRAAHAELRSLRRAAAGRTPSPSSGGGKAGGIVFSPSRSTTSPLSSSSLANTKEGDEDVRFANYYQSPLYEEARARHS